MHRLFQIQLDLVLHVAAGLRARPRTPTPCLLPAGAAPTAEEGAEEIGERAVLASEHVGDFVFGHRSEAAAAGRIGPLAAERATRRGLACALRLLVLPPVRPELVVFAALLGIAQDLVGFVDL